MRLLLLITDLERGGTPTVVRELATRLAAEVEHVEVVCLKPMGPVGDELRARGIGVTSLELQRVTQINAATRSLASLVRERRVDTVLSFLMHANVVAARTSRRTKNVRWFQSIQTTQPRPRWHWLAQRWAARRAERVIVPSESVARRAAEWSRVPRDRIEVIPNAIDAKFFRGTSAPLVNEHERGDHATKTRVGFVGRLDPVKRVPDLVAAMTHLPADTSLAIFGDGADRPNIDRAIAAYKLGNRVVLHGTIADAREAYATLDVLVLPSEAEGFGLVLIEAMAAGVPVVATNVDGIRDVVRDGVTGLLVPPGEPTQLAAAIGRVLNDATLRESLVANGRREVEQRFAWPAVLTQYRRVLDHA